MGGLEIQKTLCPPVHPSNAAGGGAAEGQMSWLLESKDLHQHARVR